MPRVEITTAGHSVVVDADGPLDQVAGKALYLWVRTKDERLDRATGPIGFHIERADVPTYTDPYGVDLSQPPGGGSSTP